MIWCVGFETLAFAVSELRFLDPEPAEGEDGLEVGVRCELRQLVAHDLIGNRYSARPINLERPLWRVDLLRSELADPGVLDRAHHHPVFTGWNPGPRVFVPELTTDPLGWIAGRLNALSSVRPFDLPEDLQSQDLQDDFAHLAGCSGDVRAVVDQLLMEVFSSAPPAITDPDEPSLRQSWL